MSMFLLFALVMAASGQTRTVGVSMGDTFTYSYVVNWNSNDPSATVPSNLVSINETQWEKVSITAVSGTNITGTLTAHYKNGTETTIDGWVNVDTGDGENMTALFISAGLVPGDSIYTGSDYSTYLINETVSRTYPGGMRDTDHINTTAESSSSIIGNLSITTNMYWDKSTGFLVDLSIEESNQTGTYLTTWLEALQIIGSSVWPVPEFSSWPLALLTLITVTSAVTLMSRRKRFKNPSEPQLLT